MGHIGFNNKSKYNGEVRYANPGMPPVKTGVDISKWLKSIGTIIGTLVLLGGLVWGSATLVAGMASEEELEEVEDRIELVEKNDLVQTVILEQIKDSLEKIESKLDTILDK